MACGAAAVALVAYALLTIASSEAPSDSASLHVGEDAAESLLSKDVEVSQPSSEASSETNSLSDEGESSSRTIWMYWAQGIEHLD